jgi:lipoprotein-anchoring transpeptidase ErfK/SrfK
MYMQKPIRKCYSLGSVVLLLAMFLSYNLLAPQTQAHAQNVQRTQVSVAMHIARTALPMRDRDLMRVGKVIIVNLTQQYLYAYQNGQEVFYTPVLTGQAALPTPVGTYHVFKKLSPTTFISPFPRRSPYWYPPTHINYALQFREPGYFLHDSWWHTVYGAGTNGRHYDPQYGWQQGSHGCVSMPLDAARWLYYWAPLGTTVRIER